MGYIQTINRIDMYDGRVIGIYFVYTPYKLYDMNADSHTMSYLSQRHMEKLEFQDIMGFDGLEYLVKEQSK